MPSGRRISVAAVISLSLGLTAIVLMDGFHQSTTLRILETVAICIVFGAALFGGMAAIGLRMAGWTDPESEADFDRVVMRAERLAREGLAVEPDETEFMDLDPYNDDDFEELVRDALDELPDLLRALIENHNVAVVISDGGRRAVPTASTTATAPRATTSPIAS
jgi:hypothetical protein